MLQVVHRAITRFLLDQAGLAEHAGAADALHLACLTLELPVPETLKT